MKGIKRFFSLLLSALMIAFAAFPAVMAEETGEPHTHHANSYRASITLHGTYHYGTCTECGMFFSEEHAYDSNRTCTVCGYMDHEHDVDYVPENSLDGDTHTGTCKTCGAWVRKEHTYDESGVCSVCGYEKHEHQVACYKPQKLDSRTVHSGVCSVCNLMI